MKKILKGVLWVLVIAILAAALFPTVAMVTASESRSLRVSHSCEALILTTDLPHLFDLAGLSIPRNLEGDSLVLVHAFNEHLVKHEIEHSRQICHMANEKGMTPLDMAIYYIGNSETVEKQAQSMEDAPLQHLPETGFDDR